MIKYLDKKLTPNQLAKVILLDGAVCRLEFWGEFLEGTGDLEPMTEREKEELSKALNRQYDRLVDFFGIDSTGKKIVARIKS